MRAIDTNILVRFATDDDPVQSAKARTCLGSGPIFLALTMLQETEWVLRSAYAFQRADIVRFFRALGGLAGVTVEDPARLVMAIDWFERGMDFADALHITGAAGCSEFVTFDKRLIKLADSLSPIPATEP